AIYVDVQVVLAAPVARSAAPSIGKHGLPLMASALGTGIFSGYVFVIPGLAALSVTGLMGISLGKWLFFGLVLGPATALVTTFIMRLVLRTNYWKPDSDENAAAQEEFAEARAVAAGLVVDRRGLVLPALPVLQVDPQELPGPVLTMRARRQTSFHWWCCSCPSWCRWY